MFRIKETYLKYLREIGGDIISSDDPSEIIRRERKKANITQEELGRLLEIRRETVSRIERGYITPTFNFVRKFSRIIAISKILGGAHGLFSTNFLSLYFNMSLRDIRMLMDISLRREVKKWR